MTKVRIVENKDNSEEFTYFVKSSKQKIVDYLEELKQGAFSL